MKEGGGPRRNSHRDIWRSEQGGGTGVRWAVGGEVLLALLDVRENALLSSRLQHNTQDAASLVDHSMRYWNHEPRTVTVRSHFHTSTTSSTDESGPLSQSINSLLMLSF